MSLQESNYISNEITSDNEAHHCTIQIFGLEISCRTWNKLMSGFHPGQLSFLLRASSDTVPTAANLCHWHLLVAAIVKSYKQREDLRS